MSRVSRDLFLQRVNDKRAFVGAVVNGLKAAAPLLKTAGKAAMGFAKTHGNTIAATAKNVGGKALNYAKQNAGKAFTSAAGTMGTNFLGSMAKKAGESYGNKMFNSDPQQGSVKEGAFGNSYPILNLLYENTKHASAVGEIIAKVAKKGNRS